MLSQTRIQEIFENLVINPGEKAIIFSYLNVLGLIRIGMVKVYSMKKLKIFASLFILIILMAYLGQRFYERKDTAKIKPIQTTPSQEKVDTPLTDLKKLKIDDKSLSKKPNALKPLVDEKNQRKLGEQKSTFSIRPGPEIIDQYYRNEGDIKKTIDDFKDNPSVEGEVTIPF